MRLGFSRGRLGLSLLVGVATALSGALLISTPVGSSLERSFGLDWMFKIRGRVPPPRDVTVVGINGRTGRALGLPKLPRDWPRSVHAQLVGELVERNAGLIIFDVDFSRAKNPTDDAVFAKAVAKAERVVLFEWLTGRRERLLGADGKDGGWTWIEEKNAPTEPLASAAKALGPFPLPKVGQAASEFWAFKSSAGDIPTTASIALQLRGLAAYDGWLAALKEVQAPELELLPVHPGDWHGPERVRELMRTSRRAFQDNPYLWKEVALALTRIYDDKRREERQLLTALAALYAGPESRYINFYGPPGTIRTISYETVLGKGVPEPDAVIGDISDHVVFVGYSDLFDPDQPDRFYTSFTGRDGVDLSGVEIMATAFANLMSQSTIRQIDARTAAICVLALGCIVGIFASLLPATPGVPLTFATVIAYGALAQWRFNDAALWLPLATPALVQLPTALLLGLMGQYVLGRRKERQITKAFSYYLPENLVADLTETNIDPRSVNKVVFGTCLATDMSGFTTLSESKSPKELASFMNEYFDALAQVLKHHAVDLTEFHADTIMCAWTAPERSPGGSRAAIMAAIEVRETIGRFAEEHGSLRLRPRIGLNDGHFYIGNTGGGGRFAYSILGDTANTAARLESLNRHLGTAILASEPAIGGVKDVLMRPLGCFQLVGKAEPIVVHEIMERTSTASAEQLALTAQFAEALDAFRASDWGAAVNLFEAVLQRFPLDGPTRFYLGRCTRYNAENEPENLSPIILMDEK